MIIYYLLFVGLWVLAIWGDFYKKYESIIFWFILFVLIVFSGGRYETGYDWPVYVAAFDLTPDLINLFPVDYLHDELSLMEPFFIILMSLVRTVGGNFNVLCFVVSIFNFGCLYFFIKKSRTLNLWVVAIYYSCLFLVIQMAVMRQSIALSFLMIAIVFYASKKVLRSFLIFAVGCFFQYSLVMFLFIFFGRVRRFLIRYYVFLVIFLSPLALIDILGFMSFVATMFGDGFINNKINNYLQSSDYGFSVLSFAYLIFNVAISFVLKRRFGASNDRMDEVLLSSSIVMVFFQIVFHQVPVFWNRFQYFGLLAQAVLLCRSWMSGSRAFIRIEKVLTLFFCLVIFLLFTLSSNFLPYDPYQFYISHLLFDTKSTGGVRTEIFFNDFLAK